MKKILAILALFMTFATAPAFAKTTPVQVLQDFSVSNPSQTLLIKILSNVRLNKEVMLHEGFYVLGQIQNVSNQGFVFMPVKFQNFHNEVFDIQGNYPAKFVEVIDPAGATSANIKKDSKILLDFVIMEEQPDTSIGERFKNAPNEGISAVVNKSEMAIYDEEIPQTMKEFPGIKLDSFDNGSNFNIPKRLIIEHEKKNSNINYLKQVD